MAADLVVGDGGTVLRVTVLDSETKQPMNLTGHTVTLRYRLNGGALAVKDMDLADQGTSPGQASYEFEAADVPSAGTLTYEVRLDDGTGDQLTSVAIQSLTVRAPL